jgi:hypothetical protein
MRACSACSCGKAPAACLCARGPQPGALPHQATAVQRHAEPACLATPCCTSATEAFEADCPPPHPPMQVFSTMAQHKAGLGVMDWGVANATLEEVFIKFARQIGAQTNEMS